MDAGVYGGKDSWKRYVLAGNERFKEGVIGDESDNDKADESEED